MSHLHASFHSGTVRLLRQGLRRFMERWIDNPLCGASSFFENWRIDSGNYEMYKCAVGLFKLTFYIGNMYWMEGQRV